ncbi:hypothetical protein CHS0354_026110 [Potamilus streckersoni]|uniref:Uncharacterized protein n=1 Tax=Potamilus streckersoni TaxID=2493646 RepID=A0AAE0S1G5_9BIVA|nr:hypothetical protein CHS0354_026110 [Potamilus streckersoni]
MNSRVLIVIFALSLLDMVAPDRIPEGFVPIPPLPEMQKTKPTPKQSADKMTLSTTQNPAIPIEPSTTAPGAAKPSSSSGCQYSFNVPNGGCSGNSPALQQMLDKVKQDLDSTKAQSMAQTSSLQLTIAQLQAHQHGYLLQISDLQNEVKNLVAAFNAVSGPNPSSSPIPTTSGGSDNAAFQQALQIVKDDLNRVVIDANNKLFNLSLNIQARTIEETRARTSLETQINTQTSQINRVNQKMQDLEVMLRQLQTVSTTPGSGSVGITSSEVVKMQAQIQALTNKIDSIDTSQVAEYKLVANKTDALSQQVQAQKTEIDGIKLNAGMAISRLRAAETNITFVHDQLAQYRQRFEPQIQNLAIQVSGLKGNASALDVSITQLGRAVFNIQRSTAQDTTNLKDLQTQTSLLKGQVTKLSSDLAGLAMQLRNVTLDQIHLKQAINVTELTNMNHILTNLQKAGSINMMDISALKRTVSEIQTQLTRVPGIARVTG